MIQKQEQSWSIGRDQSATCRLRCRNFLSGRNFGTLTRTGAKALLFVCLLRFALLCFASLSLRSLTRASILFISSIHCAALARTRHRAYTRSFELCALSPFFTEAQARSDASGRIPFILLDDPTPLGPPSAFHLSSSIVVARIKL